MRLGIQTEVFTPGEDWTWLGSAHATNTWDPITLDGDAFLTTFPTGIVPSGVILAKRTSDSLYIPYIDAAIAAGTITRTATAGSFRVVVTAGDDSASTDDIPTSAALTAATIQAAIRAIGPVYSAVTVAGAAGGPFTVTFVGVDDITGVAIQDAGTGGTDVWADTVVGAAETVAGSGTAVGFLATTKNLGGTTTAVVGNIPAALMWHGQVIVAKLPAGSGFSNAARRDLMALGISFVG
jgi:hypothetical protein